MTEDLGDGKWWGEVKANCGHTKYGGCEPCPCDTVTDRLEEIRQRAEAATPGPWRAYGNTVEQEKTGWHQVVGTELTGLPYMTYERLTTKNEDATFIAHAREDIPYLLAEVERLRAALDTEKEANVSESVCLCGHRKIDHIYEEGACRPGYVCALSCDEFTPVVGSAITEGGES